MAKRKPVPMTLSEQLRQAIADSEMSRYRICKLAEMDQGQMHRFVTTGRGISLEMLDRIGDVLRLRLVADTDTDE